MSLAAHRFQFALTILGCFGGGSLYGWSGYLSAVRAEFDLSNAAASMVFSSALVSFTLGVLLGPMLLGRVPQHFRLPLFAGLAALSLAVAARSTGFVGFAVAYVRAFDKAGQNNRNSLGHFCRRILLRSHRFGLCCANFAAGGGERWSGQPRDLSGRNTLGRIASAMTARILGPARGIAGSLILSILTLIGLIFATAPGVVVGLLFLVAFAYGQLAATTPLLVKSKVSDAAFSSSFGWVFTGWGVAGLIGPWTAGWLLDATGTLRTPLMACIVLAGFGLWLVLGFRNEDRCEETR